MQLSIPELVRHLVALTILTGASSFSLAAKSPPRVEPDYRAPGAVVTPALGPTAQIKVKEYDAFHEVLHPLEHEAVPAKDWQRIRTQANELVKRGKAIVKLGVPQVTAEKRRLEFRQELRKFNDALKQLDRYARKGTDTDVETSFASVHDSFEILLGMIP